MRRGRRDHKQLSVSRREEWTGWAVSVKELAQADSEGLLCHVKQLGLHPSD